MSNVVLKLSLPSGEVEACEIEFSQVAPFNVVARSSMLGTVDVLGDSLFGAVLQLRHRAEQAGCRLLCNAARRNAYPSPMSLEMGGGRKLYVTALGRQAKRSDMVDIFDFAPLEEVATVQEQRDCHAAWVRSLQ